MPYLAELSTHQRQTRIRKLVREEEQHQEELRRVTNRTVIGVKALFETEPRDRPKTARGSGKQPLCFAEDNGTRKAYEQKFYAFQKEHRKASFDFRNGNRDRLFPEGSFRPPIIRIITEDGT